MSDSSFGLRIGLEGERDFKRAITGHNTQALNTVNAWQQQVSNHQPELLVIPTITP